MTGLLRGYDEWRTRSPDDEYAMCHPEKYRRGVYRVTVQRTITATITVEVEASNEADADHDGGLEAGRIPLDRWRIDRDDYETTEIEGPPERDPDDARDDMQDRDYDR